MLFVPIEMNRLLQIFQGPIDFDPNKAFPPELLQFLPVLTFLAPHDRREQAHPRSFRKSHQMVNDLLYRLGRYLFSTLGAVWLSDPGKEQTKVVVDLGDRTHRGPRIPANSSLLYRYGWRKSLDGLDIRLLHLLQKLPGICRQRFHVPPLSLRIEGVKGERGFSRPAESCNHD